MHVRSTDLTLPNILSGLRILAAPVLLVLAWQGHGLAYVVLFSVAYATDFLDGQLSRLLKQETELGAFLDQVGDILMLLTLPLAIGSNRPEIFHREAWWIGTVLGLYATSASYAWHRFGRIATYHTWLGKVATALLAVSAMVAFLGWYAWPLRVSLFLAMLACLEEIAITRVLKERRSNVRSWWAARE